MTASPSSVNAGRTLASLLAEQPVLEVPQVVLIVRQLAAQVADLHESGLLRRGFNAVEIALADSGAPTFAVSPSASESALNLAQLHDLYPELSRLDSPELPAEIDAARARFQEAKITLDPRQ